ncbi:MAG: S-layer homology domain-containing protein [Clostridia bacterium]|nr:S-layer homology domain-containing protein [Clostridia bacterium]
MKKLLLILLAFTLIFSMPQAALASSFPDVDDSHWAINYINNLVAAGTINGFEDGTFRPGEIVTRAQFVKMIGYGSTRREYDFPDIAPDHWAYEYIMTCELAAKPNGNFEPNLPITRNEVVSLLWIRAGKPAGVTAPPNINRQGSSAQAVSWAYSTGLVVGDDYLNLRLKDSLTRAEAAKIIVCSRELDNTTGTPIEGSSYKRKVSYYNVVDDGIYERTYNALDVIDKPYNPDDTITNGELALAAVRLICDEKKPAYANISAVPQFSHKYAKPIDVLCRYYLGNDKNNASYADSAATVREAIMALMFATIRTSTSYIKYDENGPIYNGAAYESDTAKLLLTIAYQYGIKLGDNEIQNINSPVTMKEFANLLLEFDGMSGFYTSKSFMANGEQTIKDCQINSKISSYPANADQYNVILADVPAYVYETPFLNCEQSPKESFFVTNQFKLIFETLCSQLAHNITGKGANVTITLYPGLTWNNGKGYTLRVKFTVNSLSEPRVLSEVINCSNDTIGSLNLYQGMSIFLDIDTNNLLNDVVFPTDKASVTQYVG